MNSFIRAICPRPHPRSSGLFARAIRLLKGRGEVVEAFSVEWAEMKPIDFEGEDTSLTQEHLEVLR